MRVEQMHGKEQCVDEVIGTTGLWSDFAIYLYGTVSYLVSEWHVLVCAERDSNAL